MKHAVTLLCDSDEVEQINAHLERQVYGPGNISIPISKKGSKNSEIEGYMVDTIAEDEFKASLEKVGRQTREKRVITEPLQKRIKKEKETKKKKEKPIVEQRLDYWNKSISKKNESDTGLKKHV